MYWLRHISVLGALSGLTSVGVAKEGSCCRADAQSIIRTLSSIEGASFCSEFLGIKTATQTVTSTATNNAISTVTTTVVVESPVTPTATELATVADPTTATNTIVVTPRAITTTITETIYTDTTTTTTSVSTLTICTGGGVMKRDALPTSPLLQPRIERPLELQSYTEQQISKACNCFLPVKTPGTSTKTVTVTDGQTATKVVGVSITETPTAATVVVTETIHTPTTITVDVTNTPEAEVVTEFSTKIVTTTTVTSTSIIPETTNISNDYVEAFNGNGCVYNEYTDYFVFAAPNFADAQQQCACACNKRSYCRSFFIYYSPPTGRFGEEYDCTLDNFPFNPAYVQCSVYFAAQGKAYNKAQVAGS